MPRFQQHRTDLTGSDCAPESLAKSPPLLAAGAYGCWAQARTTELCEDEGRADDGREQRVPAEQVAGRHRPDHPCDLDVQVAHLNSAA